MKEVKITKERCAGFADWSINLDTYFCPGCESSDIIRGDNYCCNCGVKIKWELFK
jgi:hypothetical protein